MTTFSEHAWTNNIPNLHSTGFPTLADMRHESPLLLSNSRGFPDLILCSRWLYVSKSIKLIANNFVALHMEIALVWLIIEHDFFNFLFSEFNLL